ncbi:hypothetical protein [Haliangium ochraceum]|uniref:Lipoprotein n=1 Tax=Haliangium ochraceum (strain DSM 14365 / JCM 11303 / SMP-2) TaxID=502025 RepID=D0LMK5_HALO1|nr:hypothetical protein [Haliangium ochraceum]ACY18692.1 hypothetical protein Hoch_6218 [Haliangium ochraceum DSM 14365]
MRTKISALSTLLLGIAFSTGCAVGDADMSMEEEVSALEGMASLAPLATLDRDGLHFASPELAQQWVEEAPGVWRQVAGSGRLVMGAEGHRSSVMQLEDELAWLRAAGALSAELVSAQARLDAHRAALAKAEDEIGVEVTCDIALYTGPSGPIFGFSGSAALTELACTGGTVTFTVESQACTNSSGCGPYNVQTAVPGSTPALWGSLRSGTGSSCDAFVALSPSNLAQFDIFPCS